MLDFLFGVSHPAHWHAVNKKQNPDHYAWMPRVLGSTFISYAQEHLGAGLWFNIDCPVAGRVRSLSLSSSAVSDSLLYKSAADQIWGHQLKFALHRPA